MAVAKSGFKNKIIVLGSSAEFPLPRTESNKFDDYLDIEHYEKRFSLHKDRLCERAKSGGKNKRSRSSLLVVLNGRHIIFDAGPDILHQLRRERVRKIDAVFITHNHPDADYGLRYLKSVKIFVEKIGNIGPGKKSDLFGAEITAFRVIHSENAPFLGYRVVFPGGFKMVYVSDLASLKGLKKYLVDCDLLFADGSIQKRSLRGHLSIDRQLAFYKRWRLRKIIFTHIGHQTLPHEDLKMHVKSIYAHSDIAYDGMRIAV
ncbi:MAG: MBL fold metallo-hydrolase [Patescibacteria group bacterium]|nr:MBL fold metallo-hydrolase [Patescibacteria group bacterium]MCL5261857.1 MBL fold metallo-hydrolase [Patescibacteria group bacterium]